MLAPMPRAVRRPAGAARAVAAGLVVLVASGCGGIGQPAPYDSPGIDGLVIPTPTPDPADFGASIDNPWLPLTPGSTWRYDIFVDGVTVGAIDWRGARRADGDRRPRGDRVRTTTSSDRRWPRPSTRFYAQDDDGNVWWVGEDSGDATWRAGQDGAEAGLAMPADPRLGDGWLSYVVPGLPEASARVEEQGPDLVQTRDEADTSTLRTYRSGVGLVSVEEVDSGWRAVLVGHQRG